MSQLHDYRGLDDVILSGARPEVGAEHDEQGTEPLSTSGDDVLCGLGDHVRIRLGGLEQRGFNQLELGSDRGLEHLVSRLFSQHPSSVCLPSANELPCLLGESQ
jgi:hypothetical protein